MTNERKPHVHAGVIKAWADGAEVQWWNSNEDKWEDTNLSLFSVRNKYRIKPQPKPQPKTWYQVVYRDMDGDVLIDRDLYTEEEARRHYDNPIDGVLLKLIPIYTEENPE